MTLSMKNKNRFSFSSLHPAAGRKRLSLSSFLMALKRMFTNDVDQRAGKLFFIVSPIFFAPLRSRAGNGREN